MLDVDSKRGEAGSERGKVGKDAVESTDYGAVSFSLPVRSWALEIDASDALEKYEKRLESAMTPGSSE